MELDIGQDRDIDIIRIERSLIGISRRQKPFTLPTSPLSGEEYFGL
jgi:hypothetical protein